MTCPDTRADYGTAERCAEREARDSALVAHSQAELISYVGRETGQTPSEPSGHFVVSVFLRFSAGRHATR